MEPPRQAGVGPRIQYAHTADGVSIAFWTHPVRLYEVRWQDAPS